MSQGIAIVGLAGRFPGARDPLEFWRNLHAGRESVAEFTDEQLLASGVPAEDFRDPAYVRRRAVLAEPEWFDAGFFGMTSKEAELTDPQHRVFLECCWHAFEDAGYDPATCGTGTGVFASASLNTYALRQVLGGREGIADFTNVFQADAYPILIGADKDYLATRVAFKLDLRGPALTIQTACSSSLVAVAQACASLQTFQCDMALAGGVSITFPQERGYLYQEGAIPSADGRCRAFDADARGTVFGAGCGVVCLKRLEDALDAGDFVYAVIRSLAVNNDGSSKMSYGAPSQKGQAEAIALAHALADIGPDSISYVEAHGTATPLGDPIEVAALTEAFRAGTARTQFCGLGSVKTNVGHLEAAAGVTGLIKVALALRHRYLPGSLHFQKPNPNIDFAGSPFYVVAEGRSWEGVPAPRRAGLSSFGVGGTNAHAVVEEAPVADAAATARPMHLLPLSAKTEGALQSAAAALADWLEAPPLDLNRDGSSLLADTAYTLQQGRRDFPFRLALAACDRADAVRKLRTPKSKSIFTGEAPARRPEIVFLFPGQGTQAVGMGRQLYESEPVFRGAVDTCASILRDLVGVDIREEIYPEEGHGENGLKRIDETRIAQPAIFAIEYAMAQLWLSWGVEPTVLVGHSVGEFVCAVVSETFSLENALALLSVRARLMHTLPPGAMLAVRVPGEEVDALLPPGVSIAAYNSPKSCTVSGPVELLEAFHSELESKRIAARFLPATRAFHSAMMDPILPEFTAAAEATPCNAPKLPWISTCTGTWMKPGDVGDPAYWSRQLRHAVRFAGALDLLADGLAKAFVEVGPGQTLSQLVRQHHAIPREWTVVSSLAQDSALGGDMEVALTSLGRLWIAGLEPRWSVLAGGERRRRVPLPGYRFERQRFWANAKAGEEPPRAGVPVTDPPAEQPGLVDVIERQVAMMRRQLQLLSGPARK